MKEIIIILIVATLTACSLPKIGEHVPLMWDNLEKNSP